MEEERLALRTPPHGADLPKEDDMVARFDLLANGAEEPGECGSKEGRCIRRHIVPQLDSLEPSLGLVARKSVSERLVLHSEDGDPEATPTPNGSKGGRAQIQGNQDEGRVERNGGEGVGRQPHRLPPFTPGGDEGDPGGKVPHDGAQQSGLSHHPTPLAGATLRAFAFHLPPR